jgi:hypothetical protein
MVTSKRHSQARKRRERSICQHHLKREEMQYECKKTNTNKTPMLITGGKVVSAMLSFSQLSNTGIQTHTSTSTNI